MSENDLLNETGNDLETDNNELETETYEDRIKRQKREYYHRKKSKNVRTNSNQFRTNFEPTRTNSNQFRTKSDNFKTNKTDNLTILPMDSKFPVSYPEQNRRQHNREQRIKNRENVNSANIALFGMGMIILVGFLYVAYKKHWFDDFLNEFMPKAKSTVGNKIEDTRKQFHAFNRGN